MKILEVKNLTVLNRHTNELLLNNISFKLNQGEILGIVGESGSGKTLTGLSILGLLDKSVFNIKHGSIIYDNIDILKLSDTELQKIRTRSISVVFQEPMLSLNPVQKISTQLVEVIKLHMNHNADEQIKVARDILIKTGLNDTQKILDSYPHMLSGGQRQRIMIAIALVCKPEILIADEPTTALDVTLQLQILELLKNVKTENNMSMLLISHDLDLIKNFADRVIILKNGVLLEEGSSFEIFNMPTCCSGSCKDDWCILSYTMFSKNKKSFEAKNKSLHANYGRQLNFFPKYIASYECIKIKKNVLNMTHTFILPMLR